MSTSWLGKNSSKFTYQLVNLTYSYTVPNLLQPSWFDKEPTRLYASTVTKIEYCRVPLTKWLIPEYRTTFNCILQLIVFIGLSSHLLLNFYFVITTYLDKDLQKGLMERFRCGRYTKVIVSEERIHWPRRRSPGSHVVTLIDDRLCNESPQDSYHDTFPEQWKLDNSRGKDSGQ